MKPAPILILSCLLLISSHLIGQSSDLQIIVPEGPLPWTSLDLDSPTDQFQFVIVTDRTGGLRPGVFSNAVEKINLLQPQFVMSVGDLITGYTEDLPELNRQWDEFDRMVQQLDMPFFYVPGNHDITNQAMEDLWKERLGPTYYHFVYRDVLFLCLNSEDQRRGAGRGTISDEQFTYIEQTLRENEDVKWTLVFLHQPLWEQEDTHRWEEVEALLRDREHNVYAGHVHHYQRFSRNNGKYYTLATTGGGSRLRGPNLGEFDHVSWVTMTDQGPIMANLALDGIHPEDITTKEDYDFITSLYGSYPVRFSPIQANQPIKLQFHNPTDHPMLVELEPRFSFSYLADMPQNELTVAPNSVEDFQLNLIPRQLGDEEPVNGSLPFHINLVFDYEAEKLSLPLSYQLAPATTYNLPEKSTRRRDRVTIDGKLEEWSEFPYQFEGGETTNFEDCKVEWNLRLGDDQLYLAARVTDESVVVRQGETGFRQDYLAFVINADPLPISMLRTGDGWYRESLVFLACPSQGDIPSTTFYTDRYDFEIPYSCESTDEGYVLEAAIPLAYVRELQGEDWRHLRINWSVQDEDEGQEEKPRFHWQPNWRGENNLIGSGLFFRQ